MDRSPGVAETPVVQVRVTSRKVPAVMLPFEAVGVAQREVEPS